MYNNDGIRSERDKDYSKLLDYFVKKKKRLYIIIPYLYACQTRLTSTVERGLRGKEREDTSIMFYNLPQRSLAELK